ncbi:MAG: hypothetical protein FWH03_02440 [Firmicutes bacterium]|nr:hypothetical protein [Bacillota bacterium]
MTKLSELAGKPLLALETAEIAGTVGGVLFDAKMRTARFLKIFCDSDTEPEFCYVEFRRVKNLSSDACVIDGRGVLSYEWNTAQPENTGVMNAVCYNQDGVFLGHVRDIVLSANLVQYIQTCRGEFTPAQILSYSEKVVVFNDTGKPVKLTRKKSAVPLKRAAELTQQTVSVHADTPSAAETAVSRPSRVPPEATQVIRSPQKESSESGVYYFLLGKKISRPIKDEQGAILIKENAQITEDVIALARKHGKLVQLALYAD